MYIMQKYKKLIVQKFSFVALKFKSCGFGFGFEGPGFGFGFEGRGFGFGFEESWLWFWL